MDNIKIQYEYSNPTVMDWCIPITKKAKAKPVIIKLGLGLSGVLFLFLFFGGIGAFNILLNEFNPFLG